MGLSTLVVFIPFAGLILATARTPQGRSAYARRRLPDWTIDASGLFVQGVAVPFLETAVLYLALTKIFPGLQGSLAIPATAAFLLNFVLVDYAYYWNHRLLHKGLWRWHAVHHTAESLDVLVTSRNTLWSPLLIVYLWTNALFLFLLKDPSWYLASAALTAALDLWRHSPAVPSRPGTLYRLLSKILITPDDHAWHHSESRTDCNFGANLKLWDKLHGTDHAPGIAPEKLGIELDWTWTQKLLLPQRAP